jgi:hypothetical protein
LAEFVNRHSNRYAGIAAITCRTVGNVLRTAETALRQGVVQLAGFGIDQVREHLALLTALHIGAGCGRSDEELWEISAFYAQGLLRPSWSVLVRLGRFWSVLVHLARRAGRQRIN